MCFSSLRCQEQALEITVEAIPCKYNRCNLHTSKDHNKRTNANKSHLWRTPARPEKEAPSALGLPWTSVDLIGGIPRQGVYRFYRGTHSRLLASPLPRSPLSPFAPTAEQPLCHMTGSPERPVPHTTGSRERPVRQNDRFATTTYLSLHASRSLLLGQWV